jgi:hypothetical protein
MGETTMGITKLPPPPPDGKREALEELRAIRRAVEALGERFDSFASVFLTAKFPFGRPIDRWRRGA